ncbi:uncharacterized protein LOC121380160 [Gigantopelta aegis]|uniref:uncharacterized protein LOC121380160 n=1 Tax=Gigantopelta aegis TaxID=1735272 RepID=UPI001B88DC44|nr:uncharacterized protein LOC121380160 [Gigantopelta aegis]
MMWSLALICIISPLLVIGTPVKSGKSTRNAVSVSHCITNLGTFAHGATFPSRNNRCLVFRCEFGYARVIQEGCEQDGECHDTGTVWTSRDCHTNTCIRLGTEENPAFLRRRVVTGCQDVYKQCRKPGEVFSLQQRGRLHRHCYCRTNHDVINYYCLD